MHTYILHCWRINCRLLLSLLVVVSYILSVLKLSLPPVATIASLLPAADEYTPSGSVTTYIQTNGYDTSYPEIACVGKFLYCHSNM